MNAKGAEAQRGESQLLEHALQGQVRGTRAAGEAQAAQGQVSRLTALVLCRRRHSYRTGQDIANCGTCRDCACIIYR